MRVIYEFADGTKSAVDLYGDAKATFCNAVEIEYEKAPDVCEETEYKKKKGDRKHNRPHKYTGIPVSLEEVAENSEEIADSRNDYA